MTPRHVVRRAWASRAPTALIIISALSIVGIAVVAPAANAATYTYANEVMVDSNQAVSSGSRPSLTGGSAYVSVGVGNILIEDYYGYPGYTLLSQNVAPAGSIVSTSHKRSSNALSKCIWWVSVGGYADLTCKAFS